MTATFKDGHTITIDNPEQLFGLRRKGERPTVITLNKNEYEHYRLAITVVHPKDGKVELCQD